MKVIIKLFSIELIVVGCTYHGLQPEYKFAAGHVIVGFKDEVALEQAADFANTYADSIGHILRFYYYSNLSTDSLNFIKRFLAMGDFTDVSVIADLNNRIVVVKDFYLTDDKSLLTKWIQIG